MMALIVLYISVCALLARMPNRGDVPRAPLWKIIVGEFFVIIAIMIWPIWLPPMAVYWFVKGLMER